MQRCEVSRFELTEVEVEKLRNATEVYHDEALKLLQLAEVAYERYVSADMETRAEMLRCVGSNFAFDGVSISPTHRKPFNVLAEIASNEDWRPQCNDVRTAKAFAEAFPAA